MDSLIRVYRIARSSWFYWGWQMIQRLVRMHFLYGVYMILGY